MTSAEFVERYPEFKNAGSMIGPTIADATKRLNPAVFGNKMSIAVGLLAADTLARSPFARSMRLVSDDDETIYEKALDRLRRETAVRMIVL